jgi:hypothetical protein
MAAGAVIAVSPGMITHRAWAGQYSLDDGLGVRWIEADGTHGWVEVLDVASVLSAHPAVEQALRARAARHADLDGAPVVPVQRIDREGDSLLVVAKRQEGLRLSDLLADLEFGNEALSDAGLMELAAAVVRAVSAVHQLPGNLAHGAINPAHVIITRDGAAMLTDGVFATALEALQRNREQLWREFGLALPAAASLHRFDQRTDVSQLGAVVLAVALRRPLRSNEYPRGISDLVISATPDQRGLHASALRMWLQQALQLHPRTMFGTAIGAHQVFAEMMAGAGFRRAGVQALQALVRKRCGGAVEPPIAAERLPAAPVPLKVAAPVAASARPRAAFLRTMFSSLRAS